MPIFFWKVVADYRQEVWRIFYKVEKSIFSFKTLPAKSLLTFSAFYRQINLTFIGSVLWTRFTKQNFVQSLIFFFKKKTSKFFLFYLYRLILKPFKSICMKIRLCGEALLPELLVKLVNCKVDVTNSTFFYTFFL